MNTKLHLTKIGLILLAMAVVSTATQAASLTWDINSAIPGAQDGSGIWDTTTSNFWTGSLNTTFNSATPDAPIFGAANGPAGTVTLGSAITSGNIVFNAPSGGTGAYNIVGAGNTLALGSSTITANVDATISANISGGTITLANSAGLLTLSGTNNTFTGFNHGVNLAGSTSAVRAGANGALGTGTIFFNSQGNQTSPRLELVGGITLSNTMSIAGRSAGNNSPAIESANGANTLSGLLTFGTGGSDGRIQSDGVNALTLTGAAAGGVAVQGGGSGRNMVLLGAGSGTLSGIVSNGASGNSIGIIKAGSGTWTLSGANVNTVATVVDGGTLALDYSTQNNSKLADAGALTLAGGTVNLNNGSHTEVVASTTIAAGGSAVTRSSGTSTLRMNAITRNKGGVVDFGAASLADTDTSDVNGILGGYATVAGADWAHSVASGAADTAIAAYTGYTDIAASGSTIADGAATNIRLNSAGGGGNVSLGGASLTTVNTLLQNTTTAATIDTAGKSLRLGATGGVLVPSGDQSLTFGTAVNSGFLMAGGADATAGELIFVNNSANPITVNTCVTNNGTGAGIVSLTKAGSGTLVLNGTNVYGGTNTVVGGILKVGSDFNLGAVPGAATVGKIVLNGGTLQAANSILLNPNRGIVVGPSTGYGGGTVDVANGATLTYTGIIANNGAQGSLTKTGLGTLILSGANSYTFGTILNGGTLIISNDTAVGAAPSVYIPDNIVLNGATLEAGTSVTLNANRGMLLGPIGGAGTGTIDVVPGATLTYNARIMDNWGGSSSSLTKTDGGTLSLGAYNAYDGGTTISGGALQLTGSGTLGTGPVTNNGALVFNYSSATGAGIANPIYGSGSVTNVGTGTNIWGGTNLFTGGVVSTNGSIFLNGSGTLGTGALTLTNSAVVVALANGLNVTNSVFVGGGAGAVGTGLLRGPAGGSATLSGPVTISGAASGTSISVSGGLFDGGNATGGLTLSGPLTSLTNLPLHLRANRLTLAYPGGGSYNFFQDSGILVLGANNGLAVGSTLEIGTSAAGLFDLAGFNQTLNGLQKGASAATITNSGANSVLLTISGASSNTTYAGTIADDGTHKIALTLGGGTFTLSGANAYSGDTTVSGGTLKVGNAGAIPSGLGKGNLSLSGTLDLNGSSASLNGLSGGGTVDCSVAGPPLLTVGNNDATSSFGGAIQNTAGTVSLVKAGNGTTTLGGANTYSGNTTVSAGTLVIGGSISSSSAALISVASGAVLDVSASGLTLGASQTLSGSGTIRGSVTDSTGSLIVPGGSNHVAVLTITNNLTLAGGEIVSFDFAAASHDVVSVGGNLTPNGVTTVNLASLPGGAYLPAGDYVLFQVTGALGGSPASFTLSGAPSPSRQTFSIAYDTGSSPRRVLLHVTGVNGDLVWQGGLNANAWDLATTSNWLNGASGDLFYNGDNAKFTAAGAANPPVLNVAVFPSAVTFNSANDYTLSGNGKISGGAALTNNGGGNVSISATNDYTGVTALNNGTVTVSALPNGGVAGPLGAASSASANLVLNGGRLKYTGAATSTDRGATLGASGGTIEVTTSGNPLTIGGTLAGSSGGGLTKAGNDTLVLTGVNTYDGTTTISAGALQVGNGATSGTLGAGTVVNNSALVVNRSDTLAVPNNISGSGILTKMGAGTLVLSGTNTSLGGMLINTGAVQVTTAKALGGAPASFNPAQILLNGSTLEATNSFTFNDTNSGITSINGIIAVDSGSTFTISNSIASTNSLTKSANGILVLSGTNNFNETSVLNVDTGGSTGSDGVLRITTPSALGQVPTIQIRNNQSAGSSTFQLDGTAGSLVVTQAFNWSGRNNLVPAIENLAGNNIFDPTNVTWNVGGSFYTIQADAGTTLTLPVSAGVFPTTSPSAARSLVFAGDGNISVLGAIPASGSIISLIKTNNGALTMYGAPGAPYTGVTRIDGGTLNVADNAVLGVTTTNIELAPLAGETATLNISNATVNAMRVVIAGVTANNTSPGSGTVNQSAGTLNATQWFTVGSGGTTGGAGVYNNSGGTLNVENTGGGTQMEVANFAASTGVVTLSGSGTINIWNNAFISMGANANAGSGTFYQNGGTVNFWTNGSGTIGGNGVVYLGRAGGLTNTYAYWLNGGTLTVPQVTSVSGNSQFYFNGGTLTAAKPTTSFLTGLTAANVSTNASTIDSSSYAVTIAQALVHDPALGATADGGLTIQGSGIVTVTGSNSYTGPTLINSGTLSVNGSLGNTAVSVQGGTLEGNGVIYGPVTLNSGVIAPGTSIGVLSLSNNLTLQGGTVQIEANTGTNDLIVVRGTLNAASATTLAVTFPVPQVGTYTLIRYGGFAGNFANISFSPPFSGRYNFTLTNDTTVNAIKMIVGGIAANLTWRGDGGFNGWDDLGSYQNWRNGPNPDYFYDGDFVMFDNTGSNGVINLTGTLSPGLLTVNANVDYDFAGGVLSGPMALTKGGSGRLILEGNNTYGGPTVISAGTVQVGNNNGTGSMGTGPVTNNASLVFERTDATVMPAPIYGTGSVAMDGTGTMTASSSNYYTGGTLINTGIVVMANVAGLGTGSISIGNGGQVYITANGEIGAYPLTLAGPGDGNGALRKGGANTTTYDGATTLTGDTTLDVDGGATLNLTNGINGAAANASLVLAGSGTGVLGPLALGSGGLTNTGGTWTLATGNAFTGRTALNAGTTRISDASLGNPAAFTQDQVILAGGTLEAVTSLAFNDGKAGLTFNANSRLTVDAGATLTISNTITGASALTKSGSGTLILATSNDFSGTLNVDTTSTSANDGAVRITTSNALANVTSPIHSGNNNGGSSIFQLDGSAGGFGVAQSFAVTCRNSGVAWLENIAGTNTLYGSMSVDVGGGTLIFQSDAGQLVIANTIEYIGASTNGRSYTFQGAGDLLVSSAIPNGDNGAPISVSKSGAGTLTLSAANSYANATTISGGVLLLTGSISSTGTVTVAGGTLSGDGTVNAAVAVQSGFLSPGLGTNSQGALIVNGPLTSSGTILMDVNKSGVTLTGDQIQGTGAVTYGGTLQLVLSGAALVNGDSIQLFNLGGYHGTFANIIPFNPAPGLAWNTNTLATDGTLRVTTAPTVTASFTYGPGSGAAPLTVSFTNTTTGAYAYALWTFGDGNTLSSTNAVVTHQYTLAPSTNTVSLQVTNSFGVTSTATVPNAVIISAPPAATTPPVITSIKASGGNVTLSGTNTLSAAGHVYYVLMSTNVAALRNTWSAIATNNFAPDGRFTNTVSTGGVKQFYLIEVPQP